MKRLFVAALFFSGWLYGEKTSLEEGDAYFLSRDYPKAAIYFEQALQGHEEPEALFKLGICYHEIAKATNQSAHFEKSELILQKLRELENSERTQLTLARTYIVHGNQLNNAEAIEKGKALIKDNDYSKLLLALAAGSYSERKEIYGKLTEAANISSRWYAAAWYFRGLNELAEGHSQEAIHAFDNAITLLKDDRFIALCLKYKAEAYSKLLTQEGLLRGLSELNLLIQKGHLKYFSDPGEIYYLRGLMAAQLFQRPFGDIAEKSFIEGLKMDPKGKFASETMKALGIFYFKQGKFGEAVEVFEKLAKTYTTSAEAAESLLWIASCVEHETAQTYLKRLYSDYPASPFADEAYFRYYPFEEYVKGNAESLEHLGQLPEKFPESGYVVASHYLLGQESKKQEDFETAADYFEKAEIAFANLSESKRSPYFAAISQQSALDRALILMDLERLDESEIILKRLVDELSLQDTISPILEKAVDRLATIYLKEQNEDAAEKLISMMLKKYETSKIEEGYYYSRLWYDRGIIALKENSPRQALNYFRQSEYAARGDVLDKNELLDLWIQQSLCHLELGEMDSSMLILSRVANYNAASGLRIKAMYLRAEVYERQGRAELAKKQLQATSTKGGEWALKAKQKLEKD